MTAGFDPRDVIAVLRDGGGLPMQAAHLMAAGLADGTVSDAQAGAFAMAVVLRGLDAAQMAGLTAAMRDSGEVMAWDLPGPILDKHSTGGVGDVVSPVLAPILAACGAFVPMISGRGLGHTGGTLDKLEAIPGVRVTATPPQLRQMIAEAGCAIVAASPRLAPADARLYAIRDATATVPSLGLIVASILSKKLAAGVDSLVMDVKAGSGANLDRGDELARALVAAGQALGLPVAALVTDMDQPVARAIGNSLEIHAAIEALCGTPSRLARLSVALAERSLALGGLQVDPAEMLANGQAAEHFSRMIAAQGGPADFLDAPSKYLDVAPVVIPVMAPRAGVLHRWNASELGHIAMRLGAGRMQAGQQIDPRVGLDQIARPGEDVGPDQPLARVHAANTGDAERAAQAVMAAAHLAGPENMLTERPLILDEIA